MDDVPAEVSRTKHPQLRETTRQLLSLDCPPQKITREIYIFIGLGAYQDISKPIFGLRSTFKSMLTQIQQIRFVQIDCKGRYNSVPIFVNIQRHF